MTTEVYYNANIMPFTQNSLCFIHILSKEYIGYSASFSCILKIVLQSLFLRIGVYKAVERGQESLVCTSGHAYGMEDISE